MQVTWRHCPVTALKWLSSSILFAGSGNTLCVYDALERVQIGIYTFESFAIIHHLDVKWWICKSDRKAVIAVGGNRFYAVLSFHLMCNEFRLVKEDYLSDNIIACTVHSNGTDLLLATLLSTYGFLDVIVVGSSDEVTNTRMHTRLSNSSCRYSGHIESFYDTCESEFVVFSGTTFGKVEICSISWINFNKDVKLSDKTLHSTLAVQKGSVFSLSVCHLPADDCLRLAAAAEDRSIAIWNRRLDQSMCNNGSVSVRFYTGPWDVFRQLKGGSLDADIVFESRIWCTKINSLGLVAVGEDCRVLCHFWNSPKKAHVIEGVHRGHGIWSLDAWTEKTEHSYMLLAAGGNDGAVHVEYVNTFNAKSSVFRTTRSDALSAILADDQENAHTLSTNYITDETSLPKVDTCDDLTKVSITFEKEDFPRCLFFHSSGRMFCTTDLGFCYNFSTEGLDDRTNYKSVRFVPVFRQVVLKALQNTSWCIAPAECIEVDCKLSLFRHVSDGHRILFRGHIVCSTNATRTLMVCGNMNGVLCLFELLAESPYLVCMDALLLDLRIMQLIWIGPDRLVVGARGSKALLLRVRSGSSGFFFDAYRNWLKYDVLHWASAAACIVPDSRDSIGQFGDSLGADDCDEFVILGTRDGGLYTYVLSAVRNELHEPVWFSRNCHGRGGCPCITVVSNEERLILTCGRTNGEIRQWIARMDGTLFCLGLIPKLEHLTWIERFLTCPDGRLFALGFQSVNFKAYLISTDRISFLRECFSCSKGYYNAVCGGGNRNWDCLIRSTSSDATTERPDVLLGSICHGKVIIQMGYNNSSSSIQKQNALSMREGRAYLKPILHGRDINCCLAFHTSVWLASHADYRSEYDAVENEHAIYCLAAGEDTTLSSWCIKSNVNDRTVKTPNLFYALPEHHRGHISNIRCMTSAIRRLPGGRYGTHLQNNFLVTGGGRGQVSLWRIGCSRNKFVDMLHSSPNTWRPGFLGCCCLRFVQPSTPDNVETTLLENLPTMVKGTGGTKIKGLAAKHHSVDLRVMSLLCVDLTDGISKQDEDGNGRSLLVLAACSDGSIRMLAVTPPHNASPKHPQFDELGFLNSSRSSTQTVSCCLDIQLVQLLNNCLTVVYVTTHGYIFCYQLRWSHSLNSVLSDWSTHCLCSLSIESVPSVNAVAVLHGLVTTCGSTSMISVAVDDGSVRIAVIPATRENSEEKCAHWICSAVHHFASVIKIVECPSPVTASDKSNESVGLLSLGADQRLVFWHLMKDSDYFLTPIHRILLPGLGDPHGLSLSVPCEISDDGCSVNGSSSKPGWALVTGTGCFLVKLN